MKIPQLIPIVSALGIGLFAANCNRYDHYGHPAHSKGSVSQYRVGYQVRTLPPRYQTLTYGGSRYYYHNNVYYRPHGRGYIVVENPRGRATTTRSYSARTSGPNVSVIRTLPRGHRVVTYNGVRYYQHGSSYYQPTRGGYHLVANPYGTTRRNWRY